MNSIDITTHEGHSLIELISRTFDRSLAVLLKSPTIGFKESEQVADIKRHFDKLVLYRGSLPDSNAEIDHLFGAGFHGIVIPIDQAETALAEHAVQIFKKGFVFVELTDGNDIAATAANFLARGIVPIASVLSVSWATTLNETVARSEYSFQSRTLTGEPSTFKLGDRIRLKFIIEMINLRQKLMVTEINESFESSSL